MAFFRHSGTGVVFGERYWRVKRLNVEKIQAIYFSEILLSPNKHIFVSAKKAGFLWEMCLSWVYLLWEGSV